MRNTKKILNYLVIKCYNILYYKYIIMIFLALITRCKDEFFIKEFCDYYLSQGVDKIIIIDDNSNNKNIYNNIKNNNIEIIYEKNIIKNNYINTL